MVKSISDHQFGFNETNWTPVYVLGNPFERIGNTNDVANMMPTTLVSRLRQQTGQILALHSPAPPSLSPYLPTPVLAFHECRIRCFLKTKSRCCMVKWGATRIIPQQIL